MKPLIKECNFKQMGVCFPCIKLKLNIKIVFCTKYILGSSCCHPWKVHQFQMLSCIRWLFCFWRRAHVVLMRGLGFFPRLQSPSDLSNCMMWLLQRKKSVMICTLTAPLGPSMASVTATLCGWESTAVRHVLKTVSNTWSRCHYGLFYYTSNITISANNRMN